MYYNHLLILITFLLIITSVVCTYVFQNKQIKSQHKKYLWWSNQHFMKSKWLLNCVLCCAFLLYFILIRYSYDAEQLVFLKTHSPIYIQQHYYEYSFRMSKVLLLDWCPCVMMILILLGIFDYKQHLLQYFGFVSFSLGLFTIIGSAFQEPILYSDALEYTFIGLGNDRLYFMMHFFMVIFGLINYLRIQSINKIGIIMAHLFLIGYIAYANILAYSLHIDYNVGGFKIGDWYVHDWSLNNAQFGVLASYLKLKWYYNLLIMIAIVYFSISTLCTIHLLIVYRLQNKLKIFKRQASRI
ncbi:DUF5378 domain-containing protein [Ureaplasma miroungigenitalium]|uniref:DUF5378 domain-containing protein n=1 Tax=Ureaplasma miroungigenitalium TaxID=1042321 RepID=A0ABT3BNC3_9BACT|nr:DUF5378 domain-containing protein [Ureaplasma miroungigenitalium]MCV3728744.1 DUF5378 domain-containing protein [Ureaplasma miroungigenitalium]